MRGEAASLSSSSVFVDFDFGLDFDFDFDFDLDLDLDLDLEGKAAREGCGPAFAARTACKPVPLTRH